jgi:hypothetical protein
VSPPQRPSPRCSLWKEVLPDPAPRCQRFFRTALCPLRPQCVKDEGYASSRAALPRSCRMPLPDPKCLPLPLSTARSRSHSTGCPYGRHLCGREVGKLKASPVYSPGGRGARAAAGDAEVMAMTESRQQARVFHLSRSWGRVKTCPGRFPVPESGGKLPAVLTTDHGPTDNGTTDCGLQNYRTTEYGRQDPILKTARWETGSR